MVQAEVLATLEKDAKDLIADSFPFALDDRPFKPTEQHTIFIRHSVVFGDGENNCLGLGHYRYMGLQYVVIFYQTGRGNNTVYKKADEIVRHYSDKILPSDSVTINFRVASTLKLPQDVNGFSQLQVICPFYFDIRS